MTSRLTFLKVTVLAIVFATVYIASPKVSADSVINPSYFERATIPRATGYMIISDPLNALEGSVMPNYIGISDQYNTRNNGAGAIGTRALGIDQDADNFERKQAFYNLLEKRYTTGNDWDKMGVAVVVHQMTGKSWGAGGRSISISEWDDLKSRLLDNDDLNMIRNNYYADTKGTLGVWANGRFDAVRYQYSVASPVDAWVFTINGVAVYALEIVCANPLGDLPGPPPPPPRDYNLQPSVTRDRTVIQPNGIVTITHSVHNGYNVTTNPTDWWLTRIIYSPGAVLTPSDVESRANNSAPCDTYPTGRRVSCDDNVQRKTGVQFGPNSDTQFSPNYPYVVPANTVVGTKICFVVSVKSPTRDASPLWKHSTLKCVIVAKEPKLQVWGGDVRVGGEISTSTTTVGSPSLTYGSWGEYAAFSNGDNSAFATGSGLNLGNVQNGQSDWSKLTFANSGGGSGCSFGCYGFTQDTRTFTDQFVAPQGAPALGASRTLQSMASDIYTAGTLSISGGGPLAAGKRIVIIASGTVTISGDIIYDNGPYSSVQDIPRIVIKAPNIKISGSVRNIDAWLLATTPSGAGSLNTCSDVAETADLTESICNNQLRINGPVVTNTLYLRRTAGSEGGQAGQDKPAEIFNLRADAFMSSSSSGQGTGSIRTITTTELPPRF